MDAGEPRPGDEEFGFNSNSMQGAGKGDYDDDGEDDDIARKPRPLPDDLPRSLDDRRSVPTFGTETEMYDAWQGGCA